MIQIIAYCTASFIAGAFLGSYYGFVKYRILHVDFLTAIERYQQALSKLRDDQLRLNGQLKMTEKSLHEYHILDNSFRVVSDMLTDLRKELEIEKLRNKKLEGENSELEKVVIESFLLMDKVYLTGNHNKTWQERLEEMKNRSKK